MRKAVFIVGFAVGFIAGARSGRETYDKIVGYGQQVAGHPKVQQATSAAQAKATDLAKTAAAKAPDYAKSAAKSAQAQVSQVPKYVSTASQAVTSKIGGGSSTVASGQDDVGPDGNLVYPAEGEASSFNGAPR